ncbi:uncharacterized protein MELLADRAFT_93989 [Melampsora larici-populina 98AG31]|uniref:Uncharacterized protein n=1 Tax=Melampsora larici-populina (strain 98AG31 / pathotype 3-4-7) TaxID=747676 RepID=F4S603_MELLP|nr:uncharacterized protein MELLADRAFT_93989 [Melampsora larici-populina 98AG31]EGF99927.1 hypothetical protein MELLADRAFT_93989 [Melampsora larici-populina 98AG31]
MARLAKEKEQAEECQRRAESRVPKSKEQDKDWVVDRNQEDLQEEQDSNVDADGETDLDTADVKPAEVKRKELEKM